MWLSHLFHSPLSQPHLAESSTSTSSSQHPLSIHYGPHSRYQAKHFTHSILLNSQKTSQKQTLVYPFYI